MQIWPVTETHELAAWCAAWNDGPRLLPRAPADLAHESALLPLCERYAIGPAERPVGVGALRRHFAFAQGTRLALDLRVRPGERGKGAGSALLAGLLARARALRAEVVRAYAPEGDAAWDALAMRHQLQVVERDRYLVLDLGRTTLPAPSGPEVVSLAAEPDAERGAWRLEQALHAGLETSAPAVPETHERWRARVLEAPGSGPANVLVTRARAGGVAGICALRVCAADPETLYHAFTGVSAEVRGHGHGRALKIAAIRRARELGARRLVADTSPSNAPMLALNARLGYVPVLDVRNLEGPP